MIDDRLTIRVESRGAYVPADSLIKALESVIEILRDVDTNLSGHRRGTVRWSIAEVSFNSPLMVTLVAESLGEVDLGREIIQASTGGLRQIESSGKSIPPYFSHECLEQARQLVSVLNDGIARITVTDPWTEPVVPSQHLAANVEALLPKSHEELGTLRGTLEAINIQGQARFYIWEQLTGRRVECRFERDRFSEARDALDRLVALSGRIRYSAASYPASIQVEELRVLKHQRELPQFRDLEGIDITRGEDPSVYLEQLHNGD